VRIGDAIWTQGIDAGCHQRIETSNKTG